MSPGIFMSYRRSDNPDAVGRLYDRLVAEFGKARVFKDVDSIPLGRDFRAHLDDVVGGCAVVLAIIGPRWVDARDATGNRRLEQADDFVRIELEAAMARDTAVLPVLVGNAAMPGTRELPESLASLSFRQAINVRPDPDFHNDATRLVTALKKILGPAATEAEPQHMPKPADLPARTGRTRWPWIAAAAGLAATAFAVYALKSPHTPQAETVSAPASPAASTAPERSIAVLPLVNASSDKEQQFFSDGVSENLIDTLSKYEGLKVIGRSSSFQFRDSTQDSQGIGAKLGVAYLIAGSVQRVGDAVRIGVELVDTRDGSVVWTQRFDRPYKDLFAVQDEIAAAIAGALQIKLLYGMPGAVEDSRPASGNLEAYNAYLRGTAYINKDWGKAIEQFGEAVRTDPNYAQAWQWMGYERVRQAQSNLTVEARHATCAQARREIETAITLAPNYGLAHTGLGNYLHACDHDWTGALMAYRKGMMLVSDTSPAHGAYSRALATLGKVNEAIEERRKYIVGDPLANYAYDMLAGLQASRGQLDEAEASARKAMEVRPADTSQAAEILVLAAILRGDAAAALTEARRIAPGPWQDRYLALALAIGKDRAAAEAALQSLIKTQGQGNGGAFAIARVHALRGDAHQTFEWLNRDWERGDDGVLNTLTDPLLLRFRDDPRFIEYCRKTGLPPPSESEALSIDQIRARL